MLVKSLNSADQFLLFEWREIQIIGLVECLHFFYDFSRRPVAFLSFWCRLCAILLMLHLQPLEIREFVRIVVEDKGSVLWSRPKQLQQSLLGHIFQLPILPPLLFFLWLIPQFFNGGLELVLWNVANATLVQQMRAIFISIGSGLLQLFYEKLLLIG